MAGRHFVGDAVADSMTPTGLSPQHLRPANVTSERLTAVENANDRVEFLLTQLLMAEEAAREELVTSVERAEREQMAQIVLDPVPDPDLEPDDTVPWVEEKGSEESIGPELPEDLGGVVEPEADGASEETEDSPSLDEPLSLDGSLSLDEPLSLDGPLSLDEPTDPQPAAEVRSGKQAHVPSIPQVIPVEELPEEADNPYLRPEVRLPSADGEVLAAKEHSARLEVGTSVMDDDASGRTRELLRRGQGPRHEGFFATVGAFVARALHLD